MKPGSSPRCLFPSAASSPWTVLGWGPCPLGSLSAWLITPLLHTLVPPRGLEVPPRGWSVSLHSGDSWQDLAGCDFVLDLIGQTEDLGDPAGPHSYPITPRSL